MRMLFRLLLSCLIVTGIQTVLAQEGGLFPDPVATVNGEAISRDAFYRRLLQMAGQDVLKQLVEEQLVRQEAQKRKLSVTDEELQKRVEAEEAPKVAQRRYSAELYPDWLKLYTDALRLQMLKEKLMSDKVTVAPEEIERAYTENRDKYPITVPEGRRVSFILFPKDKQDLAQNVRSQLEKRPERFGELAREHSISNTRERGGEHPYYVYLSQDPGADERAIFALERIHDISPVVPTTDGLYIIRLDDIIPKKNFEYEEVKDKLSEMIRQQRLAREYTVWRAEQIKKAKVEVFFEESKPSGGATPGPG